MSERFPEVLRRIAQNDYMIDAGLLPDGRALNAAADHIDALEAEVERLHHWVLTESGGATLTPNTVDAAIFIGTVRGHEMQSAAKERDFWERAYDDTNKTMLALAEVAGRQREALAAAEVALAIAQGYRPITRAPDGDRIVVALGKVRAALEEA